RDEDDVVCGMAATLFRELVEKEYEGHMTDDVLAIIKAILKGENSGTFQAARVLLLELMLIDEALNPANVLTIIKERMRDVSPATESFNVETFAHMVRYKSDAGVFFPTIKYILRNKVFISCWAAWEALVMLIEDKDRAKEELAIIFKTEDRDLDSSEIEGYQESRRKFYIANLVEPLSISRRAGHDMIGQLLKLLDRRIQSRLSGSNSSHTDAKDVSREDPTLILLCQCFQFIIGFAPGLIAQGALMSDVLFFVTDTLEIIKGYVERRQEAFLRERQVLKLIDSGASIDDLFTSATQILKRNNSYARKFSLTMISRLVPKGIPIERALNMFREAGRDDDEEVRAAAAEAIGGLLTSEMAPVEAWSCLRRAAKDSSDEVRRAVAVNFKPLLTAGIEPTALLPLVKRAIRDVDGHVRQQAIAVLAYLGEKRADLTTVFSLAKRALEDNHADNSCQAMQVLVSLAERGTHLTETLRLVKNRLNAKSTTVAQTARQGMAILVEQQAVDAEEAWRCIGDGIMREHILMHPKDVTMLRSFIENMGTEYGIQVLSILKDQLRHSDSDGQRAARQVMEALSAQVLIDLYWEAKDTTLIPWIATHVSATSFRTEESLSPGKQTLVLYEAAGNIFIWEQTQEDIQAFLGLVQTAFQERA
ncbi:MAG: HEAT repeat domain-containing protein, partial [Bacteroidota bacterium]